MNRGRDRAPRPWHLYVLGAVAIAVAVLAINEVGAPNSPARTSREIVTAQQGIVQSTVSGSGNVQAGTDVSVNFNTSGTLQTVDVSVGQHVNQGQLLATLDPTSAQYTLDQAEANLTAAQDQLTALENGTASSSSSSGSPSSSTATNASLARDPGTTEFVSETSTTTTPTTTRPTSTTPRRSRPTPTRQTTTAPTTTSRSAPPSTGGGGSSSSGRGNGGGSSSSSSRSNGGGSGSGGGRSTPTSTSTTNATSSPSPASIASAQAAVYSAEAAVHSAQTALANTKLYAPTSGTIASLSSLTPGDQVSGGSTSGGSGFGSGSGSGSGSANGSGSSGSSGSGSSGSGSGSTNAGSLGDSGAGGSSSRSGGSGSGSAFAQIINTSTMTMTVAFSESDISKVKLGQPATVTLDALPGVQLAAHVSSISLVGTTSSSVVSYDATLTLDQTDSRVKPGMSASASVIVGQAQGVTVPNQAVTGSGSLGTVNLWQNGKAVPQQVVVGLRGDSRTQIVAA